MSLVLAGVAGALFAVGLLISSMTVPSHVLGFLDLLAWDPSLAFVLIGALGTYCVLARVIHARRRDPWFDIQFHIPARNDVDIQLVLGSALFGVGWGLSGFCPGPALVSSGAGSSGVLTFIAAMFGGMLLYSLSQRRRT
jgi:uncharacterized membrane protein YedE/YeeE